jgi:hypothetical protein
MENSANIGIRIAGCSLTGPIKGLNISRKNMTLTGKGLNQQSVKSAKTLCIDYEVNFLKKI